MKTMSARMTMAAMLAATLGSLRYVPLSFQSGSAAPKQRKPVPKMVTASPEEIAAWNKAVEAKRPRRASPVGRQMRREDNRTIGHRQAKREAYLFHDGYADKHPTIAARFAY